ncbi:Hypothetical predicted protein [Mytilus galloprovincialis]|uniref:Uncharacterized protein n=1 Tax=Mytilus galloprovincialis TaxID=29158 RepID=A0A8B6F8U3_MYTGA|nr:Hypothetical predicted protein [Mytilus galloprovincialis]
MEKQNVTKRTEGTFGSAPSSAVSLSEDSLSTFANNVGGNFKVRLPKRYTLDGSWECALLEVSFIPELEASTRRMYFCSDFVHQSYVRETALPYSPVDTVIE